MLTIKNDQRVLLEGEQLTLERDNVIKLLGFKERLSITWK